MLEEPYEGNLHVRICGGIGQVTGRFYPEPDGKKRGGADAVSLGGPLVMLALGVKRFIN